jgi:hypothetical protein
MTQISMKKNMWCHFEHEGHRISIHFSTWSGQETVYVDDHPVSQKRNLLRFSSSHLIEIDDQQYSVELEIENPFTYKALARLKKGARTLQQQQTSFFEGKHAVLSLVGFFCMCLVLGYGVGKVVGYYAIG